MLPHSPPICAHVRYVHCASFRPAPASLLASRSHPCDPDVLVGALTAHQRSIALELSSTSSLPLLSSSHLPWATESRSNGLVVGRVGCAGRLLTPLLGCGHRRGGEGGSRYEGSFAPCTSRDGRVAGVVGRRGGLLRVIQRAAGCGASSSVRSATVGGSVAFSRYLQWVPGVVKPHGSEMASEKAGSHEVK